jgi:hypothetical protein
MIDLDAEIIPGVSAAGLLLGSPVEPLLDASKSPARQGRSEERTHLNFGAVKLWCEGGKIQQISVSDGYRGTLPNGVRLGMSIADVENCCSSIVEEDEEDNLIVRGSYGWCFDTEPWGGTQSLAENRGARIIEILVFLA